MINGFKGFLECFWQLLVILSIMDLFDRLLIDNFGVGHTNAWIIPGTEDLKPYITKKTNLKKHSKFEITCLALEVNFKYILKS